MKFKKKRGVQNFLIKMEGLLTEVGLFSKKGISFIFHTNPFQCCLFLSVWCVCVCVCVCTRVFIFIYTISISICISQEDPSLIESNQQIYDLQVNNI